MDHLDKYIGPEPHPHMSDVLLRRCGLNHLGFPIWRMVRSEYVVEKVGGRWSEWNDDLSVADRGGITTGDDGKPTETAYRPDRIVFDVRETQAYSHFDNHGWLLQRWYPASFFGSPQSWAESVVMDMDANGHLTIPTNIPILGPYPSEGRYIEQYGPVDKEPSVSFIIDFIADWEARRDAFPDNVQEHIRMRVELR